MNKPVSFSCLCLALILVACQGSTGQESETETEDIFFDYRIWGEEGNDSVTVMLQFKAYGPTGPAIRINAPGSVSLDGKKLSADSTEMTGHFYAVTKHIKEFTGKHTILFTSADKKKFKEEFHFSPFNLKATISDTLTREKMTLQFEGLDKWDVVRVLLTDTSYLGDGINQLDTVWNNRLVLFKADLLALENGPIHMELIKERERPVDNGTATGGSISIFYTIRRELYLRD